jgi:hypothetical protein
VEFRVNGIRHESVDAGFLFDTISTALLGRIKDTAPTEAKILLLAVATRQPR